MLLASSPVIYSYGRACIMLCTEGYVQPRTSSINNDRCIFIIKVISQFKIPSEPLVQ